MSGARSWASPEGSPARVVAVRNARLLEMGMVALALLLLAPSVASASSRDPAQAAFVQRVVEAINSQDPARQKALVHPKSVCTDVEPMSFFSAPSAPRRPVPPTYRWMINEAAPGPPMFSDKLDYPVRPTHLLQIDYETGPTAGQTLVLQVARSGARWYVIAVCPKPATLGEIGAAKKAEGERAQQVRARIDGMPPALRQAVLDLVKQGQRIAAIRHYEREAGVDLTMAKDVVDRLIENEH
jgi:hypothetical protein